MLSVTKEMLKIGFGLALIPVSLGIWYEISEWHRIISSNPPKDRPWILSRDTCEREASLNLPWPAVSDVCKKEALAVQAWPSASNVCEKNSTPR